MELSHLATETRNQKTIDLDSLSTSQILEIMNEEDSTVPLAIKQELSDVEAAVTTVINSFNNGGRLIYIGAGTSGRLGILDAVECVPTFGTSPELVQGLIAGGEKALIEAVEGAEDSEELAVTDLKVCELTKEDVVIGIAASGRTPYVIGGLKYANQVGAATVAISCNKESEIGKNAQIKIEVEVGPEILTGSTRLKSGTAQKLVLNMISTASMIGIGKVYKNLMVDVQSTNLKLIERSKKIVMDATDCDYETAEEFLGKSGGDVKLAIVMLLTGLENEQAQQKLVKNKGFVRKTIQ
ncbi:N-acetylmuramic acid 6-phosphate etherase [Vagococcus penaei]|uniref:N-acetylmuramic acid 6-phosphate etherase n=1 Tax=Vagococcus penaei TaxID=633807 RepID=A0A1Q2D7C7_9ENTE|nr:N-acetylmuramic acid 6-phosphate etherase [Vagococcus penaei]AQP54242.1 N-acetylmuramic acid 6-phosphate etherase [Vagococcus penaei]RSU05872.1 N-acetylmuramic acid 6-phosphate etherase [Vagococcus penaei]